MMKKLSYFRRKHIFHAIVFSGTSHMINRVAKLILKVETRFPCHSFGWDEACLCFLGGMEHD